ncbi:hypothetical protein [Methylobacterium sp. GXF4]|uniref:hypothetical protein n=1 Tax=Methylobacterium sp. GXF4 TaxID=1096546 RepID=UPI0002F052F0|nr:hypothetical protein [Methylobacterium sp. GXF4]
MLGLDLREKVASHNRPQRVNAHGRREPGPGAVVTRRLKPALDFDPHLILNLFSFLKFELADTPTVLRAPGVPLNGQQRRD